MSTEEATTVVTGVDFVSIPTEDLERAVEFYGTTLGLRCSVHRPEANFAEFDTASRRGRAISRADRSGEGADEVGAPAAR
jgi:catechol 2,3-dioxygenase-like lactoylglutathione lyase family enzyme